MTERESERTLIARDGTRIAYAVAGEGSAFVLTNGLTTTTSFWKYVRPIWLRNHTVITWDLPGHGRSGPAQSAATARVEAQPELMMGILDALAIERAVHIGWSTGCQLVLEAYRQFPERCSRLALLFGLLLGIRLPNHPLHDVVRLGAADDDLIQSERQVGLEIASRGIS